MQSVLPGADLCVGVTQGCSLPAPWWDLESARALLLFLLHHSLHSVISVHAPPLPAACLGISQPSSLHPDPPALLGLRLGLHLGCTLPAQLLQKMHPFQQGIFS